MWSRVDVQELRAVLLLRLMKLLQEAQQLLKDKAAPPACCSTRRGSISMLTMRSVSCFLISKRCLVTCCSLAAVYIKKKQTGVSLRRNIDKEERSILLINPIRINKNKGCEGKLAEESGKNSFASIFSCLHLI